jgi:hypothetical protein
MIENHTPIKKRTLPQGTLDTLKLGRPADMVRPVAVDHKNSGRLGSLFHRRGRGKSGPTKDKRAQRQKKDSDRKKAIHEKIPARGREGSISLKKPLGRPMPIGDILPVSTVRSNEKYPAFNMLKTGYFCYSYQIQIRMYRQCGITMGWINPVFTSGLQAGLGRLQPRSGGRIASHSGTLFLVLPANHADVLLPDGGKITIRRGALQGGKKGGKALFQLMGMLLLLDGQNTLENDRGVQQFRIGSTANTFRHGRAKELVENDPVQGRRQGHGNGLENDLGIAKAGKHANEPDDASSHTKGWGESTHAPKNGLTLHTAISEKTGFHGQNFPDFLLTISVHKKIETGAKKGNTMLTRCFFKAQQPLTARLDRKFQKRLDNGCRLWRRRGIGAYPGFNGPNQVLIGMTQKNRCQCPAENHGQPTYIQKSEPVVPEGKSQQKNNDAYKGTQEILSCHNHVP